MKRIHLTRHGQTIKWAITQFLQDVLAVRSRDVHTKEGLLQLLEERERTLDEFIAFAGDIPNDFHLSDLTQRGREEARILGRYLTTHVENPYFLTSHSPRTIETADLMAAEMGETIDERNSKRNPFFSLQEQSYSLPVLREQGKYLVGRLDHHCPPERETIAVLHAKVNTAMLEALGEVNLNVAFRDQFIFGTGGVVTLCVNGSGVHVETPYLSNDELQN